MQPKPFIPHNCYFISYTYKGRIHPLYATFITFRLESGWLWEAYCNVIRSQRFEDAAKMRVYMMINYN